MPCFQHLCGIYHCSHYDDGILCGNEEAIPDKYKGPISVIFQKLLKTNKILGNKVALEFSDNVLTFNQLEDFSSALANDLRDRIGMDVKISNPDGDPVIATIIPNSEKAVVLILAILKTGAAYLPLDEDLPEDLLIKIISTFKPVCLIVDDNGPVHNKFESTNFEDICQMLSIEELWINMELPGPHDKSPTQRKKSIKPEILDVFPKANPSDPPELGAAAIFHIRGLQDDLPVGLRVSHLSILNRCIYEWQHLDLMTKHSCSFTCHLSQSDSLTPLFAPLLKGCTLHLFRRQDLKYMSEFVRSIASKFINRIVIPYYYLFEFLNVIEQGGKMEMAASLKCVEHITCRSGLVAQANAVRFFELFKGVPLCICTGCAETTGEIVYETFKSIRDYNKKLVMGRLTLGHVLNNSKIYILNDKLKIISDANQGEIYVSGLCLGIGYVGQESGGRGEFVKNPHENTSGPGYEIILRTGEFGRIIQGRDHQRRLYVEGRDDKLVKQKGHEFRIEEVKVVLSSLKYAKEAFVYIVHKGKPTQEMVAFILLKDGVSISSVPGPIEIEFTMRSKLPDWAIPDEIVLIDELPTHYYNQYCPFCMIQEFRERREPKSDKWEKDMLIFNDKQKATIALVKAIFKMTSIPVEFIAANLKSSFYELGGNSTNTIQLLVYLNKIGYPVTIKDFYCTPNLTEFVNVMMLRKPVTQTKEADDEMSTNQNFSMYAEGGVIVRPNFHIMLELKDTYDVVPMKKRHRNAVIKIISTAYCEKGDLQAYNMTKYKDYEAYIQQLWIKPLPNADEHITLVVIKKSNNMVVAVCVCHDFFHVLDVTKINGSIYNAVEFFHEVKGNVLLFLPHRMGETLEIRLMATHKNMDPQDNVKIITMLHTEIIKIARQSYSGIFHATTNSLSRALCLDVFGYDLFDDFQVNKYTEADETHPFHLAGDTIACAAMYLKLRSPDPPSESTSMAVVDPMEYFNQVSRKSANSVKYYHGQDKKKSVVGR